MRKLPYAMFMALISCSALSAPELKGSPQELRGFLHPTANVVTISANANEKAYSDKAIVSLVITTEDKLLSQSIASNSTLREQISGSLTRAGLDPAAIKSSKFSSSPEYGWFGNKPSSFKVVNRVAVSITREKHLHEIAKVTDQYKEVELAGTTFEHSQKDQYNEKVKSKALAKVLKQKEFYEKSLGLELSPVGIRDSNIQQRATRGAMVLEDAVLNSVAHKKTSSLSSAPYQNRPKKPSFDEIQYEAKLSVDFKIIQQ